MKKHKNSDAEMIAFSERFNRLLDAAGVSPKGRGRQVDLAQHLSLSPGGARKLLEAESEPSAPTQRAIFKWLKSQGLVVNLNWLVTGEGEMLVEKQEVKHSAINPELLDEVRQKVGSELKRSGIVSSDTKTVRLETVVYNDAIAKAREGEKPKVDMSFLKQMVKLMT